MILSQEEIFEELRACVGKQANDKSGLAFEEKKFLNGPE